MNVIINTTLFMFAAETPPRSTPTDLLITWRGTGKDELIIIM